MPADRGNKMKRRHFLKSTGIGSVALLAWMSKAPADTQPRGKALACRAVEEYGRVFIGEPVVSFAHTITLFAVSKRPVPGEGSIQDHLNWVGNPLHTCISDGTGALSVIAHPSLSQSAWIASLRGLTGLEVHYAGEAVSRDELWDSILCLRCGKNEPLLWAFAADDTHSKEKIGLSWYSALLPVVNEVALKKALRDGAFYVSNGPVIRSISVKGTRISVDLGQASEVLWLRAGQFNAPKSEFTVSLDTGRGKCLKQETNVTRSCLDITAVGIPVRELQFVRAIVRTSPNAHALSQPFRIEADGAIVNPYPADGTWVRGQTHNHADGGIGARINSDRPSRAYRDAYMSRGMEASFELEYSYWEVPLGRPKSDGFPDLTAVVPSRVRSGFCGEIRIEGVNFKPGITVRLNDCRLNDVTIENDTVLRAKLPGNLVPGTYDVVVTNPDRFQGALCDGLVIQEPNAIKDGWSTFTVPDLPWSQVISLAAIGDDIWAGTMYGAVRFTAGRWERFLPGNGIYGIAAMPDNRIVFTVSNGLKILGPNGKVESIGIGCGAKSERWAWPVFDTEGRLWVGGRWNNGIGIRGKDGEWIRWSKAGNKLPGDTCQALLPGTDNVMWAGFGSGLRKWTGNGWQEVKLPAELGRSVAALAKNSRGDLWVAVHGSTSGGAVCLRKDGTTQSLTVPPLPSRRITAILQAEDSSVWFASRRGVARLNPGGQWSTFTTRNSGLAADHVLALAKDSAGRIWFATGHGVSVLTLPGKGI